jgi:hypothetical protein
MFPFQPKKYTKDLSICIYLQVFLPSTDMPNHTTTQKPGLTLVCAENLFMLFTNLGMSLSNDSILLAVIFSSANFPCENSVMSFKFEGKLAVKSLC